MSDPRKTAEMDQILAILRDTFDSAGVNVADPVQLLAIKTTALLLGATALRHGPVGLSIALDWLHEL